MTSGAPAPALFISYSHKDDAWRARLDAHLALLKRQQIFDVWHDRRIGAGEEWAGQIDEALERARVVLLLVSSDFLASDYCYDVEMKRALERHAEGTAKVVPVILRDCDWHAAAFGKLQAVPADGKAIASHDNEDTAMTAVAQALRRIGEQIREQVREQMPEQVRPAAGSTTGATADLAAGSAAGDAQTSIRPLLQQEPVPPKPQRFPLALRLAVAALVALVLVTWGAWLKPKLDESRALMRRGEYAAAVQALQELPAWAAAWPGTRALREQAGFGARLAGGEHLRALAPQLDALAKAYPRAPDVQVFLGLKAYQVDRDIEQAIRHFQQAVDQDDAHLVAHFLAVGRLVDRAYLALGQGDDTVARQASAHARGLVERIVARAAFAADLPDYANQIAELEVLEGRAAQAYARLSRLAPQHPYSAVQAAVLAWQLPQPSPALRDSAEALEAAAAQVAGQNAASAALQGWTFRVTPSEAVEIHPSSEKLCLMHWVLQVSRRLEGAQSGKYVPVVEPEVCGTGAIAQRIAEVVCVEAITASGKLPDTAPLKPPLASFVITRCNWWQKGLPSLPASAPTASIRTDGPARNGAAPAARKEPGAERIAGLRPLAARPSWLPRLDGR